MKKDITSFEQRLKEILAYNRLTSVGDFEGVKQQCRKLFSDHQGVFARHESFEEVVFEKFQEKPFDTTLHSVIEMLFSAYLMDIKKNGIIGNLGLSQFIHKLEIVTLDNFHKPKDQFQGTFICKLLLAYLKSGLVVDVLNRMYMIGWIGNILATNTQDAQYDYSFNIIEELEKTFPGLPQKKTFKKLFDHPFDLWEVPKV